MKPDLEALEINHLVSEKGKFKIVFFPFKI